MRLGTEYYEALRPHPPQDAYEFYRTYVAKAKGPVLEPMCGSGRFLLPLLNEGFEVHGFDASIHMLDALKFKATQQKLSPNIWQGLIENLNSNSKYSLIFIPSGSFGHLIEFEVIQRALQVLYEHLDDEGVLLFEVENSRCISGALGVWREDVCHRVDGSMILVKRFLSMKEDVATSIDKYELIQANQIIRTEVETLKVRFYDSLNKLTDIIKSIGFKDVHLFKAFNKRLKPSDSDSSMVFECVK